MGNSELVDSKSPTEKKHYIWICLFFFFIGLIALGPALFSPSIFAEKAGDVFHNLWIWGRNVENIKHGFTPYSPNIFFPDGLSSFYSEMEVGNSVLYGLLRALGFGQFGAYGIIVYVAFVGTAIATAFTVLELKGGRVGAVLAGTVAAFVSYRYTHIAHIQLLATYFILIPFFCCIRYFIHGHKRWLVYIFVAHLPVMCGPSYNLFGLFAFDLAIFVAYAFNSAVDIKARFAKLLASATAIILAWAVTFPVWWHFYSLSRMGFVRKSTEHRVYSLDLADYFTAPAASFLYGEGAVFRHNGVAISFMFVGFVALCLAVISFVKRIQCKNREINGDVTSRIVQAVGWCGAVLVLVSLGPAILWNGNYVLPNPVFSFVEMSMLLAPFRYIAQVGYFGIVACAIYCGCSIHSSLFGNSIRRVAIVTVLVAGGIVFENYVSWPSSNNAGHSNVTEKPAVADFLHTLPEGGSVVFLPLPVKLENGDSIFERQLEYMRLAEFHRLKMVNGISGFFPGEFRQAMVSLASFPTVQGLAYVERKRLDYLVIDKSMFAPNVSQFPAIDSVCDSFNKIYDDEEYSVYRTNHENARGCLVRLGYDFGGDWWFHAAEGSYHQIGKFDPAVFSLVASVGEIGCLHFGPYVEMPVGKYRATFSLRATGPEENAGFVDINGFNSEKPAASSQYGQLNFKPSEGMQKLSIDFVVINPALKNEFRVYTSGKSKVEFFSVRIDKLN